MMTPFGPFTEPANPGAPPPDNQPYRVVWNDGTTRIVAAADNQLFVVEFLSKDAMGAPSWRTDRQFGVRTNENGVLARLFAMVLLDYEENRKMLELGAETLGYGAGV